MVTRRVVVFRHMEGDSVGRFAPVFSTAGYSVDNVDLFRGEAIPDLARFDLMLVLGGAMDVWQEDAFPWLKPEKQAICEWVGTRAKPYLGICLGHQLLAAALGGEVGPAAVPEIGVHEIAVQHGEGGHPFFSGITERHTVLQWHQAEVKRLPPGGRALATSARTPVQAMAVGNHALGVQFHCEWTLESMRDWAHIDGWVPALEQHLGPGGHQRFLAAAAPHMPAIARMTETLYDNFARRSGLAG